MKLAFSQAIGEENGIRTLFTEFRKIGYDGLQLKGNQYAKYLEEPQRFIDDWGAKGAASALITGGTLDAENRQKLTQIFKFGQAVGTELLIFCHGVSRKNLTDGDIRGFGKVLSEVGKQARQYGIKLSLHHHFDNPVMHRKDFDVFFDSVEDKMVGLTVDTAHLAKSGVEDIAELIQSFAHVIDNFHLKDLLNGEFKMLGRGQINFAPVFAAIRKIGYDGWCSADEESGADVLDAMRTCHSFMVKGLSDAAGGRDSHSRSAATSRALHTN